MTLSRESKDALAGMVLNAIDGRDPTIYIEHLDGEDCVAAHNVLRKVDEILRKRWLLMDAPEGEGFIEHRILKAK